MNPKILLVLSPPQRPRLLRLLEEKGMETYLVAGIQEAQQKLRGLISYDLLLVDAELSNGAWRDLLQFILDSKKPCELIVCSRLADERLWAEVIQYGAFDLITEPYEEREVIRIVQSALDSRYMRSFVRTRAAQAS